MNIAEHAQQILRRSVLGVKHTGGRKCPPKSVLTVLQRNERLIGEWVDKGVPASLMSGKLDVSNTSFGHHIVKVLTPEAIEKLKENGDKANRSNSYKAEIVATVF